MKDCNHPQLQNIKIYSSGNIICPDCKQPIFFMSDKVRELLMKQFKFKTSLQLKSNIDSSEIGSLYGVPVFISKTEDEK